MKEVGLEEVIIQKFVMMGKGRTAAISLEWLLSKWSLRSQRQQIIRKTEEKKGMAHQQHQWS